MRHVKGMAGRLLGGALEIRKPLLLLGLCSFLPGACSPQSHDALPFIDGLEKPLYLVQAPGDAGRFFVVEQTGRIKIFQNDRLLDESFLDLSDDVFDPTVQGGGERGLLGLAFHPAYERNGFFFVNYTDRDGHTRVVRFTRGASPERAEPASAELVLRVEQPYSNHNGGHLLFGPDGYLYIGLGDGGSKGDPENRAQNDSSLLGKMLRIDMDRREGDRAYAIPPDNPFVGRTDIRPEIWAKGLRNPWRYSFDRETGDLWIGDVGQWNWEEVDFQPAASPGGENYGWRLMEGDHCFEPKTDCDDGSLVPPFIEYSHYKGCSITGGHVYRGEAIPSLRGHYLFADWCEGQVWALDPATRRVRRILPRQDLGNITSFGEDHRGELYVLDGSGGRIWKIVDKL